MLIGPIFTRELAIAPRRAAHYIYRTAYPLVLFVLMVTAWLLMAGTQNVRNVGDIARFGSMLFQILAPLQIALLSFLAAQSAVSGIAQEKDKRTMLLLLMTRLSNHELVLGKLFASLLDVFVMLLAALPIFMLMTLFARAGAASIRGHSGHRHCCRQLGLHGGARPREDVPVSHHHGARAGHLARC